MTLDGFVTFWTLLVAIYAIMPQDQRLNLDLKLKKWHIASLILAFIEINLLEFYGSIANTGVVSSADFRLITPQEAAYLVTLIFGILFISLLKLSHLSPKKIKNLNRLSDELLTQDRLAEAVTLIESNLARLVKIYKAEFSLQKTKRWLSSFSKMTTTFDFEVEIEFDSIEQENTTGKNQFLKKKDGLKHHLGQITKLLSKLIPEYGVAQNDASEVFRSIVLRPEFISHIAKNRPYFGLEILKINIDESLEFSDEYLREMLSNGNSALYWEVRSTQNQSSTHEYVIPENNKILWYFFDDATVAETLAVWRPIGEYVLSYLNTLHAEEEFDQYNRSLGDYKDRAIWKCPIFAGIRLFDIMMPKAILQGIEWHMWVYYLSYFVEKICRNYKINPSYADPEDEFPTVYSYLLYEIVSSLRCWIELIEETGILQQNVILKRADVSHENGNPIKSCILVLSECIRSIACNKNIPFQFKQYVISIYYDLYFQLKKQESLSGYSDTLQRALLIGGLYERNIEDPYYLGTIIRSLVENDNVPHEHAHVIALLKSLVQKFLSNYSVESLESYVKIDPQGSETFISSKESPLMFQYLIPNN